MVPGSIRITNESRDTTTQQWDGLRIEFDIDTTGKSVNPGDTFEIGMPAEFDVAEGSFTIMNDDGTAAVATCAVAGGTNGSVTCTFTDYVATHRALTGSGYVYAQAAVVTDATTVDFQTAQGTVAVPLPNGPGIIPGTEYIPDTVAKTGWFENSNPNEITWRINVPAGSVTGAPLAFSDTLGAGQTLVPGSFYLQVADSRADAETGNWTEAPGLVATIDPDGTSFSATFAGYDPTKYYQLLYRSTLDDPASVEPGDEFTNTATVNGSTASTTVTKSTIGGGQLDGPGFGGVSVVKEALEGDAASEVPADTEFTVRATYTMDGQDYTREMVLTAGGVAAELHRISVGTQVTLSEIDLPTIDGVTWGDPVFASSADNVQISADGTSAVITIGDQTTTRLQLTNTATRTPVTPTPAIDIEKWSTDQGPVAGDHDTASDSKPLKADADEAITFTITNTGTEPLVDIEVSDRTIGGSGTVDGLTCDFSPLGGPSSGTTWAGPFAVDASFTCTGTLSALGDGATHADRATVIASGQQSGRSVDDSDDWHGHTPAQPEQPQQPEQPDDDTPDQVVPGGDDLAATGAGSTALPVGIAGLLLTGAGVAALARRRRS